jgi:hypothetical protein
MSPREIEIVWIEMVETEIAGEFEDLQTMFPVEIGDADRILCAFNFQIIFRGFFSYSVRNYILAQEALVHH